MFFTDMRLFEVRLLQTIKQDGNGFQQKSYTKLFKELFSSILCQITFVIPVDSLKSKCFSIFLIFFFFFFFIPCGQQ
jgi:hypothetical protein